MGYCEIITIIYLCFGGIALLKYGDSIIINSESPEEIMDIIVNDVNIITCGLSLKSSITASSIDDSGFVYCVQRGFPLCYSSEIILPQEFKVSWNKEAETIYPCLETVTLMLLSGITPDVISKNLFFHN